tara:strand:- start:8126 stop:8227 length:102 start_codon:yes stop_codon:yes gene_type:complete
MFEWLFYVAYGLYLFYFILFCFNEKLFLAKVIV